METQLFSRSVAAQNAARCVVEAARANGLLDAPVAVDPEFAEAEKALMLKVLAELGKKENLSADETSSLFSFVFAKSAEAVTNFANHRGNDFEMLGLFDGKIPICAEEKLTERFKTSLFPRDAAQNFWDLLRSDAAPRPEERLLSLGEALKWCFRLGCHFAVKVLEENRCVFL
ncbi:MAG: hypothetical protein MJ016_05355 [Victivallaceae bacterium]|nr:hypothetical protein [Victivallaceae bacterium]